MAPVHQMICKGVLVDRHTFVYECATALEQCTEAARALLKGSGTRHGVERNPKSEV